MVDGSGWEGVYNILTKDGYRVSPESDYIAGRRGWRDSARRGRAGWSGNPSGPFL